MRRIFDSMDLEIPSERELERLAPLGLALLAAAGAAAAALSGVVGAEEGASNVMMLTICAFPRLTD